MMVLTCIMVEGEPARATGLRKGCLVREFALAITRETTAVPATSDLLVIPNEDAMEELGSYFVDFSEFFLAA